MRHEPGYSEDDQFARIGDFRLWKRILAFILPQWRWVAAAVLLSFVITAASLALPRLVQLGMDNHILAFHEEVDVRIEGVARLSIVFLGIVVVGFIANFIQVMILEWTGQRTMHALRQRLFTHVVGLNLSFFHTHPVGRLVTRLTNDIQNMYEMFTSVIVTLFNDGVRLVGILAILFWMNWRLALILSVTFPLMAVITYWFGRFSRDAFRQIRTHLASINAFIQETVSGIAVIQLFLREKDIFDRFGTLNGRYYKSALYQIWIFGIFVPLIEVMNSLALALIIWYGGGETIRGHMTIGILTAFIAYMRLFSTAPGAFPEVFHRAVGHGIGREDLPHPRGERLAPTSRGSGVRYPHRGIHRLRKRGIRVRPGPPCAERSFLPGPSRRDAGHRRSDGFREDHRHQPARTLLRSLERQDTPGRYRPQATGPLLPA